MPRKKFSEKYPLIRNADVNQGLKQIITRELANLSLLLGSENSRLEEIVKTFIDKTPAEVVALEISLDDGKIMEASRAIHKIKTRYGYFGLQSIIDEFDRWEEYIKKGQQIPDHHQKISDIKQQTAFIIDELKKTNFASVAEANNDHILALHGKLVLIAEDDEVNGLVFELFIKESGATTVLATDGMQALTFATARRPDLILMDVHMPFFSGLDAIRELRRLGCDCPIVSLSASTRLNERQNSFEAGANDFLIKPVNRDTITKVLFKYLS